MNICVLSMQRVPNFGSLLQGYALKSMLESLGHDVTFIDIEKRPEDDRLLENYRKEFSNEYKSKGKKYRKIFNKYFFNKLATREQSKRQSELMSRFQSDVLKLEDGANAKRYDCCVIGSDEVFNALNNTEWGFTSQLFGNVAQADKVITYAASCGFTAYDELPQAAVDTVKDSFKRISHFSVRDANTFDFVKKAAGIGAPIHCDPVVMWDFTHEAGSEPDVKGLPEKYCIVYAYHDRINAEPEINAVKSLCKKENMKIISVGASQAWIKHHVAASPFQIPKLFSNAQFVVTDTFHGTIFAAKYSRKLAVIIRRSNENKLSDLMKKLEIEDHKVQSAEQLPTIYQKEHDLTRMREIEARERARTTEYLNGALN